MIRGPHRLDNEQKNTRIYYRKIPEYRNGDILRPVCAGLPEYLHPVLRDGMVRARILDDVLPDSHLCVKFHCYPDLQPHHDVQDQGFPGADLSGIFRMVTL